MPVYYFIYLTIIIASLFLALRYFICRKKSLPMLLFKGAVRSENDGHYQEAARAYENALSEVKKSRFHGYLKIKISEKIRLLQMMKTYKDHQAFVRKDNSWIH